LIIPVIKENILMVKNKEKENILGQMVVIMKEIGMIIK
jgi:hypothetical protein